VTVNLKGGKGLQVRIASARIEASRLFKNRRPYPRAGYRYTL
jgi:hypothetical protein